VPRPARMAQIPMLMARLQFGLQFNSVPRRPGQTDQGRWTSLNRSGQRRPELLMRLGLGSHTGSHLDEQPRGSPDSHGQRVATRPRSRTGLNSPGGQHRYLRIRRLGNQVAQAEGAKGCGWTEVRGWPLNCDVLPLNIKGASRFLRKWPPATLDIEPPEALWPETKGQAASLAEAPRVRWRLRCFGFRDDYSMSLAY
jgi:hypothetical protein